ncbi:hypothetical protein [Fusobacterium necrophorum]|uniref:P-type conjugative transfer protein TrbJ n=1 Tax=Fusobacterium necrophorum TaxID=859 RepID=A0A4Q2KSH7_9FUSO|nr:hypothetical protein [Fusobacterium necrophorum]RXZ68425.1 hypothetical protein EPT53_09880 [Fusobacterium necrophorum]
MKTKIKILIFLFSLSFSLQAARPVVEVGPNVKANLVSKIEQTKATVEAIKQTQNQIIQLKNDALNLNKWAGTILETTTGLSLKDIDDLRKAQRDMVSIISDVKDFRKKYKELYSFDVTKFNVDDIQQQEELLKTDYETFLKESMNSIAKNREDMAKTMDKIKQMNNLNSSATGALQAAQVNNQIAMQSLALQEKLIQTILSQQEMNNRKELQEKYEKELEEQERFLRRKKATEVLPERKSPVIWI